MRKMFSKAIVALSIVIAGFSAQSQTLYDSVATAYVTTTISQDVVFDNTMQAGGTFTFSVLAHNGGGRQGQSDTANVKITFYSSSNAVISTVSTNYSANLPQPTASGGVDTLGITLSGNPEADPAVPWTLLSVSSTNCGGSCANVAYAVVTMYGVDGSFWAGDYGPWYRAPTLTLNGGSNLLYNPEFGPYNGVNAQGWAISPALGACQGAWGGSNTCIVDNTGAPGVSTTGLVANQDGGGPSATGGTTSGAAGGYNNTMSVANPGPGTTGTGNSPAPAPAPTTYSSIGPGSTVTSDTLASGAITTTGGTLQIVSGSTTVTNSIGMTSGTLSVDENSQNGTLSGIISGAGSLEIANSGTGGSITLSAQNTYTGATTVDSRASLIVSGSIATSSGVTNNGEFTITSTGVAPNITNAGTTNNYGTVGTVTSTGNYYNYPGSTSGSVTSSGNFGNAGSAGNVVNSGLFDNAQPGTIASLTNTGTATNEGTVTGAVTNSGTFTNSGTTGNVNNSYTFYNAGAVGAVTNSGGFILLSQGTLSSINNSGIFNITGAGGTVNVNSYTQTGAGLTVMSSPQQLHVSGASTLAGSLTINNSPTNYGLYTLVTAGTVTGTYNSFTLPNNTSSDEYELVYTATKVELEVTPNTALTQASIASTVSNLSTINTLQTSMLDGALGNDCANFGDAGVCVSASATHVKDQMITDTVSVGFKLTPNIRFVAGLDRPIHNIIVGDIDQTNKPTGSWLLGWNANPDATGLGLTASYAKDETPLTITRTGSAYSESATGNTLTEGTAYQVKASYAFVLDQDATVTPYIGIRKTRLDTQSYTETGAEFPITYNDTVQSYTDALAGVSFSYKFTPDLMGFVSAGVTQNERLTTGAISGTSNIIGLNTFSNTMPGTKYTAYGSSFGFAYRVDKTQMLTVGVSYQERTLTNLNISSLSIGYTIGY